MGFSLGIVGLPNVGKSTIFNALTNAAAEASNYQFCTIEPNVGVVPVPDPRLKQLSDIAGSAKIIPTSIEFVDIAGLIAGASEGEGLGNKFLAHIREVDAVAHVVRCFEDENIIHVDGGVSPRRDVEVIETELMLSDLASVEKRIMRVSKQAKSGDKEAQQQKELLEKAKVVLDEGRLLRSEQESLEEFATLGLITSKPLLFVANVEEAHASDSVSKPSSDLLSELIEVAKERNAPVEIISGKVEEEIRSLEIEERKEFLDELGLVEPGLDRLARAGYNLLELLTFFTVGPKETHAWTCQKGSIAPQAAGKIHTDFEKGFIRAEVIAFEEFIKHKGEAGAKENGSLRVEGKDYVVADGDVVHFRFNV